MKVLLAIDSSVTGKAMTAFVASHVWPDKTTFRFLHVFKPTKSTGSIDRGLMVVRRRQKADRILSKAAESIRSRFPKAKIECKVIVGPVREAILAMAKNWDADLVLVGSSPKREKDLSEVLGSVSTAIAFQCACSVLVVRRKPNAGDSDSGEAKSDISMGIRSRRTVR